MPNVTIYTSALCGFCHAAKRLLNQYNVSDLTEISVDADAQARATMMEKSGRRTVPQIWIGERHVGGFDDLNALHGRGELSALLGNNA